ncbi:MAG TPA: substrate-binding domain-containing protein, partial [Cyclobacteriaceae bacterium]
NRNVYADRLRGQILACREKGIEHDGSLVIINTLSDQEGAEAALELLKLPNRPDGIFTASDTAGVAVIRELKQAGVNVPGDIAVVGFNNDPISRVIEPNLTTINYPGTEMGEVAASTLVSKLKDAPPPNLNTVVLRHELIVRESSLRKK